ncbi:MarR family transcriptional regulator [Pseudodesulfovibrio sp. JC047]|uniref:MarR family winged helix-turn-helix transcriptional regulator n=1 Tax=Pseudodesulfovibrio sp. JC047 TaxID=2683199 RepID=UPI0031BB904B
MTNDLSARFAEAGLDITVEQWRALIPAYKRDGLTQGELCEVMSQEKTGVSRLVSALEKRGLLRRESSKADRRVKFLYITEAGRTLIESSFEPVVHVLAQTVKDVDPAELAICQKVLWQIITSPEREEKLLQNVECSS